LIFYLTIASLTMPSVLVSLGIGIVFQVLKIDTNWFSSGLGAHLTRTVPFAFLIMLGVFNRTGAGFSPYCGGSIITSIHKTTSESIFQG
jgi:putative spermidine/putrescine transport system permease protein